MFRFGRNKKNDDAPVDPEARSEKLGIRYKDLQVLYHLIDQGADLQKPRHVLYYLYFATRDSAEAAAEDGRASGYRCDVRDPIPERPADWRVVCERSDAVLDPGTVIAADNLFQGIAERLGGDFDGWEAAATP